MLPKKKFLSWLQKVPCVQTLILLHLSKVILLPFFCNTICKVFLSLSGLILCGRCIRIDSVRDRPLQKINIGKDNKQRPRLCLQPLVPLLHSVASTFRSLSRLWYEAALQWHLRFLGFAKLIFLEVQQPTKH